MAWSDEPTDMQLGVIYSWIRWLMPNEKASEAVNYLETSATRKEVSDEIKRLKELKSHKKLDLEALFSGLIWEGYKNE